MKMPEESGVPKKPKVRSTWLEAKKYYARGRGRGVRARPKYQDGADEQSASTIESLGDRSTDCGR